MKEKILEKITDKKIYIVMLIGFLISLIPIIVLATYNFPCGDDFSASDDVRLAWMHTGSVIALLKAAWDNVVFNYLEWSGVYMSVFWTSLQPGLFGEQFYWLTTFITVGLFCMAVSYFVHVIFTKYFPIEGYAAKCLGILYLFTIIQCVPYGNEGLFWHAGTANYCWAFSFLVILISLMLSIYKEKRSSYRIIKCAMACIFAIFVGGGNYISGLQGTIWMVTAIGVIIVFEKWNNKGKYTEILKANVTNLIPVIVLIIAFAFSVFAPGNEERKLESVGMGVVKAVFISFYYCLEMFVDEWLCWPILLLMALAIPFMWQIAKKQKFQFGYPAIVVLLCYAFASAAYTPLLYAQGNLAAPRVRNIIFFIEILMIYIALFYMTGWISKRIELKEKETGMGVKYYICIVAMFFLFASAISIKADDSTFVASEAFFDIVSGQAAKYKEQNEERLVLYLDEDLKDIVVKRYVDPPMLLHVEDNVPDPTRWINLVTAKYYEKESVRSEGY